MKAVRLYFEGTPRTIQGKKVATFGGRARLYTPAKAAEWKARIAALAKVQLPTGFKPFDTAIAVRVSYVFDIPQSWSKKKRENTRFKATRPDLADNLAKNTFDALNGIIWKDDSLIVRLFALKVYGQQPGITIEVESMEEE